MWHEVIGEKTIAAAIMDRIVYQSIRIELYGESLRKKQKADTVILGIFYIIHWTKTISIFVVQNNSSYLHF
jgi:IstB-like ATP binding protein